MTIKQIKSMYYGKYGDSDDRTMFATCDYHDGNGKIVIVVTQWKRNRNWKTVWQAVRVRDGKELIEDGRCRPCDNLEDAIDVAGEMMMD